MSDHHATPTPQTDHQPMQWSVTLSITRTGRLLRLAPFLAVAAGLAAVAVRL